MNKEFCTYEQALASKELGFNEQCMAHLIGFGEGTKENGKYKINQQQVFYPNDYISSNDKAEELGLYPFGMCGVPLYQQAFRWFREKYKLHNGIYPYYDEYEFQIKDFRLPTNTPINGGLMKYEEAELACLIKLIEIVKTKKYESNILR